MMWYHYVACVIAVAPAAFLAGYARGYSRGLKDRKKMKKIWD
jgi:hypothetical protein